MKDKKLKTLRNWCKRHIKRQKGMCNDSGQFDTMDYLLAWEVIGKIDELIKNELTTNK